MRTSMHMYIFQLYGYMSAMTMLIMETPTDARLSAVYWSSPVAFIMVSPVCFRPHFCFISAAEAVESRKKETKKDRVSHSGHHDGRVEVIFCACLRWRID